MNEDEQILAADIPVLPPGNVFDIKIVKAVNGCIVTVGCKTFVFSDIHKAMVEIGEYLTYPVSTIKRYKEKYKF